MKSRRTSFYRAPVAILAFDRPEYLRSVLESVVAQQYCDIESREVFFFQDGATNPFSGQTYVSEAVIGQNLDLFRTFFPHSKIYQSPVNLGIGLHFDFIERLLFEDLKAEAAIFLEDDFVLTPTYLRVLDSLVNQALDDSRIGYVSAVGDHTLTLEEQHRRRRQPMIMRRNWAFGLTKRQWDANRLYLDQYLSLIRNVDYRERPHLEIFDLYSTWGAARIESSQDRAKAIASTLNGSLRLNTTPCYGKYIGERGEHSNEAMYELSQFRQTPVYSDPIDDFGFMTNSKYVELLTQQQRDIQGTIPVLRENAELRFSSGSEGALALGRGFQPPEDWGAWSSSNNSSIVFYTASEDPSHHLQVEVTCRYHLPEDVKSAAVRILVHDIQVDTIFVGGTPTSHLIEVPPGRPRHDEPMTVTFLTDTLGSPSEYRDSSDQRKLGLGILKIALRRIK